MTFYLIELTEVAREPLFVIDHVYNIISEGIAVATNVQVTYKASNTMQLEF